WPRSSSWSSRETRSCGKTPVHISLEGGIVLIRVVSRGLLAACCVFSAALAAAQTNTGQISGTVKDTSGAVLPGVTVTVTNVGTNIARTTITDDKGAFVVTSLPVGTYKVSAELQ